MNCNSYKFIKDCGIFKKGDILTWDKDLDAYTLDVKEENSFRSAIIDQNTVNRLSSDDYVIDVTEKDKVTDTLSLIDNLLEKYESDYKKLMSKYDNGKILPCVKVEAETVYYNLTKVLNRIKKELTDE